VGVTGEAEKPQVNRSYRDMHPPGGLSRSLCIRPPEKNSPDSSSAPEVGVVQVEQRDVGWGTLAVPL
jgi:hypothetical protein